MKRKTNRLFMLATLVLCIGGAALAYQGNLSKLVPTAADTMPDGPETVAEVVAEETGLVYGSQYYIQNVESGLFLCGANDWNTRASLTNQADLFVVNYSEGVFELHDADLSAAYRSLGTNLYTDSSGFNWDIQAVPGEKGVYTISNEAGYIAQSTEAGSQIGYVATQTATVTPAAKWLFLTREEAIAQLATATSEHPKDATFLLRNANFGRLHNQYAWILETNGPVGNLAGGDNNNTCAETWRAAFTLSQQLTDIPNGLYSITAQGFYREETAGSANKPVFFANEVETEFPMIAGTENSMSDASKSFTDGLYTIAPLFVEVTDGVLTVGAKSDSQNYWCIWDNFNITYYGLGALSDVILESYAELRGLPMEDVCAEMMAAAYATYTSEPTEQNLSQLSEAVNAARNSADAYARVQAELDKLNGLLATTNVINEDALYYKAGTVAERLADRTLPTAEAANFKSWTSNWHGDNILDDIILAPWTINGVQCKDYNTALNVNTWSEEGDTDGSDYRVPFLEYWTDDNQSLDAATMTATMKGLTPSQVYDVTAWTRVRTSNYTSAAPYGISFQVGNGKAVDACPDTPVAGANQLYLANIKASGAADENGTLTISYIVNSDNNVSWLAWKNMTYVEGEAGTDPGTEPDIPTEPLPTGLYFSASNTTGEHGSTINLPISMNNGDAQILGFGLYLQLPEGVTVAQNQRGEPFATLSDGRKEDHTITASLQEDGSYYFVAFSPTNNPFIGGEGEIFSVPLVLDAAPGEYPIVIKPASTMTCLVGGKIAEIEMDEEVTATLTVKRAIPAVPAELPMAYEFAPDKSYAVVSVSPTQEGTMIFYFFDDDEEPMGMVENEDGTFMVAPVPTQFNEQGVARIVVWVREYDDDMNLFAENSQEILFTQTEADTLEEDLTELIQNAIIAQGSSIVDLPGWIADRNLVSDGASRYNFTGGIFRAYNGSFKAYQIVQVPAPGLYRLEMQAGGRNGSLDDMRALINKGSNTYIYANDAVTTCKHLLDEMEDSRPNEGTWYEANNGKWFPDAGNGLAKAFQMGHYHNSVYVTVGEDCQLEIGFYHVNEGGDSYGAFYNAKLYKVNAVSWEIFEELAQQVYEYLLDEDDEPLPQNYEFFSTLCHLQEVISTEYNLNGTISGDSIMEFKNTLHDAKISVEGYKAVAAAIAAAEAKSATLTEEALAIYNEEIQVVKDMYESGAIKNDEIELTIAQANAAYSKAASSIVGEDLSFLIENPTFDTNGELTGWTKNVWSGSTIGVTSGLIRAFNSDMDISQTLVVAPGIYKFSANAVGRGESNNGCITKLHNGEEQLDNQTYIYANDVKVQAPHIISATRPTNGTGTWTDTGNGFIPDNASSTNQAFLEGMYPVVEAIVEVGEDGILTIGFSHTSNENSYGDYACFDNATLTLIKRNDGTEITDTELPEGNILVNGNAAGEYGDIPCAVAKVNEGVLANQLLPAPIEIVDGSHVFAVHAGAKTTDAKDNQFWILSPRKFYAGDKVKVSFRFKADKLAKVNVQAQSVPGTDSHSVTIGDIYFTPEWLTYSGEIEVSPEHAGYNGFQSIVFNLSEYADANNYYFDDLVMEYEDAQPFYVSEGSCVQFEGYGYAPMAGISVNVEAYESYVIIRNAVGQPGLDLKVDFDTDENVKAVTPIKDGMRGEAVTSGYFGFATGDPEYPYAQLYVGDGYSYATSDPDDQSGYILLTGNLTKDDGTQINCQYSVEWPYDPIPENLFAMEDVTGEIGKVVHLPVSMNNGDIPFINFGVLIDLPEGVTVATDQNGNPAPQLSAERAEDHTIAASIREDGAYYFLSYSNTNTPYLGGEGVLFTVPLVLEAEPGEYAITLRPTSTATKITSNGTLREIECGMEQTATLIITDKNAEIAMGESLVLDGDEPMAFEQLDYYVNETTPGVLLNNGTQVTVKKLVVHFEVEADQWYFFTPMGDVMLQDIQHSEDAAFAIRMYDPEKRAREGKGWSALNDDRLHAQQGYIIQSNAAGRIILPLQDASQMLTSGDVTFVPQSCEAESIVDENWNFLGNPYPCYYNIGAMECDVPLTVYENGSYQAYRAGDDDYVLRPMQAFFVQKPDYLAQVVFHNDGRQETGSAAAPRAMRMQAAGTLRSLFDVVLTDGQTSDRTRVVLNDAASEGYEIQNDAAKFMSENTAIPQIFTIDKHGYRLAINERPMRDGIVRLGVFVGCEGDYSIKQTRSTGLIKLYDAETGLTTILNESDYAFHAKEGTSTNRFYLLFGEATGIDILPADADEDATRWYNIMGQRVSKTQKGIIISNGKKVRK